MELGWDSSVREISGGLRVKIFGGGAPDMACLTYKSVFALERVYNC